MAKSVPIPTISHFHEPRSRKLSTMAMTTSEMSTRILALGKGQPVTCWMAMEIPSPGLVTEPHFTSMAIPKPRTVQPAICTRALIRIFSETIHSVSTMLRSMSIPKKKPMTSWKSCTYSKFLLRIRICSTTKMAFIMMV